MAQRTIDTLIKLSGESEYRSALKNCGNDLKVMKAELDATTSEFRNNANSMEALTQKGEILGQMYAKQQERVDLLAGALEKAKQTQAQEARQVEELKAQYNEAKSALAAFGDQVDKNSDEYQQAKKQHDQLRDAVIQHQGKLDSASTAVTRYSTQLSKAKIELNKLDDQVQENKKYLAEAENAADGCATSIDQFGKKVKASAEKMDDAADEAKDLGNALEDAGEDASDFGEHLSAELVADAIGTIVEGLGEAVEASKEYRKVMASLKESSELAGYSARETSELYGKLNGVLADTQAAATTTANLQALGIEQGKLQELTDGVIGSWAKYGDSIPIDGLAEAVNHTAQLGEVQGTLADVIEWGGGTVEDFNVKLAACADATERADLISRMFAEQGLTHMGQAWQQNNASLVASNQAAAAMEEQVAILGETVEPVFTAITDACAKMLESINDQLEAFRQQTSAADDLAAGMDAFTASMTAAQVATHQTAGEVESTAFLSERYLERLEELEAAGLTTAEAQQEYADTVALLNEQLPQLNLTINEQTGLLEQDTKSIRANLAAWKDRAMRQAYEDQLTAQLEAQAAAQMELDAAERQRIALAAEIEDAERRRAEALERTAADTTDGSNALTLWSNAAQAGSLASSGMVDGLDELAESSIGVDEEVAALDEELAALRAQQSALDGEIRNANDLIAESEAQINATADAADAYNGVLEDSEDAHEDASGRVDELRGELETLEAEYQAVRDAARDSIDRQVGLFEKVDEACEMSTQDMIDNLKTQREAFTNYADNIQLAMERGIDEGLVQTLSDGSVESMQILAELVDSTDEEIQELNKAWAQTEEAKDYAADSMAQVSDTYVEMVRTTGELAEAEAYAAGQATVDGLIAGVNSKAAAYKGAVGSLASAGQQEYQRVNMIKSPSRRYREFARNDVDGLIVEYRESKPRVEKATAELANTGYHSILRSRQAAMPDISSAVAPAQSLGDSRLYGLLGQLLEAVRAGQVLTLDKTTFVGGTAGAYDSKFGQFRALAERGAI